MKLLSSALILTFLNFPFQAYSSVPKVDSLFKKLKATNADTNRVQVLVELSRNYIRKKDRKTSDLDSALLFARQAIALSQTLQFYKGIGNSYLVFSKALREKGKVQEGRSYAERAKDVFIQHEHPSMLGYAYSELTRYYSNAEADVSLKIRLNEKALTYFVLSGDTKKEADILKEQGDLHQLQGNYYQSLSELQRALSLYHSINFPDVQGVYDLLGFVSSKLGDYKSGLAYGFKALKTAQIRGDTSLLLCTIYNRLGITYHYLGKSDEAHYFFKESLSIAQKYNHIPSVIYLSGNISSIQLGYGDPRQALITLQEAARKHPPTDFESRIILSTRFMDVYSHLMQYPQAQFYCKQVLDMAAKYGAGSLGMAAIYHSVIQFLLASKQYKLARKFIGINHTLCLKQGSAGDLAINHLQGFRLDSTLNIYPSAIAHYQRYVFLRDSLLTESRNLEIAQLDMQYQTEKKDQEIKLKEKNIQLLTQQAKFQQQQLKTAQLIRNGTILGASMLVLLLGLGYNRYRLKQKTNHLLEAKQLEINQKNHSLEKVLEEKQGLLNEKEWMLKEIHHQVRNNLQIVTSLLNSQASYLSDNVALSTIKESQHRVQAMAFIHQKLYQTEQVARVNMASYTNDLVVYLRESYNMLQPVRFNLLVKPLELDVTLAVPVGLIINETLTNSLKYAFPEGRSGTITLRLQSVADHTYQLSIADDGVGLPHDYNPSQSRSLGMRLMHGLSKQIDATLTITGQPGVNISLIFRDEQLSSTYSSAEPTNKWFRPYHLYLF